MYYGQNERAYKAFVKDFRNELKQLPKEKVAEIVKPANVLKIAPIVERHQVNWENVL